VDVERDITVLVKTFERPEALRRLVSSIRRFYPSIAILAVDDSREPLEPAPEGVSRYWHLPYNSAGLAGGRNFGLRHVETPYVLVSDDDMVFGRKTDLGKLLATLESTSFDLVSCRWLDHDPYTGVRKGFRHWEGTLDVDGRVLVHRYGASRGEVDGLPAYDIVHNFFVASVATLGPDPWDERLKVQEHTEFFLTLKERGIRSTIHPDVVVYHHQAFPEQYEERRGDRPTYYQRWLELRDLDRREAVGSFYTRSDKIVYELPSTAAWWVRRAGRVAQRAVRERRLRS
jgi:glycosyltransferase involved in cell wall biosynthesis